MLRASERVQRLRDRIDEELVGASGSRRERLLALRGEGDAENPNISYGSITASPLEAENIVGLQEKLIYMLKILQAADARPTTQAIAAVEALSARVGELEGRL